MTRLAAALVRALPPRRPRFNTTLADLTAAYERVQRRTNWEAYRDPLGD